MKKIIALIAVVVSFAHGNSIADAPICPTVAPIDLSGVDDAVAYYDHYIKPVVNALSTGKAIVNPTDIKGKLALLEDMYDAYSEPINGDWIEVIQSISALYSTANLNSLDTNIALSSRTDHPLSERFKKLVAEQKVCISRMVDNNSKFGINFYGATRETCQGLLKHFPRLPGTVLLNSTQIDRSMAKQCLDDHVGLTSEDKKLRLKRFGRNQLTFVYLK